MRTILGDLVKTILLLAAAALLVYDIAAIRPRLAQIDDILAKANPQDTAPPEMIQKLIDANAGSPTPYAIRLVTTRFYSPDKISSAHRHVRDVLWQILLPIHLGKTRMYGLYATLAYNGTDYGLSNFAAREYGKPLDQLSPMQAANTVAITSAPASYHRNRDGLARRATMLLSRAGYAP